MRESFRETHFERLISRDSFRETHFERLIFRDSFLEVVVTVPGDGYINYKPLFETLYDNKYSKCLIVEAEQDPKKANPLKFAKIGYKYLNRILTEVGYQI